VKRLSVKFHTLVRACVVCVVVCHTCVMLLCALCDLQQGHRVWCFIYYRSL